MIATAHADAFWIIKYFSVGPRATRPLVMVDAVASRELRKEGAAAIRAPCIAVATAPMGGIVFAMF